MFENDSTLTLRLQTLTNEANIGNSEKLRTLQKLMKLFLQKGNKKDARLNNYNHISKHRFDALSHRRRKYGGSSPNSLRPISYFGRIWELHVLDLKTNVFCRKKIQLHFAMNKRLTVPK